MPTTYASAKQFLGLAKETTHGTAVAPTLTMPVSEFTPDQTFEWLADESWRGHLGDNSGIQQGVTKGEFDLKGPAFLDTLPHLLLNILGDLTTTGASAPYSHAVSLLNSGSAQPPSHTFTHFQGPAATVGARQWPGACLSELTLKWNAESELFTVEAKGTSWGSQLPGSAPTAAPSTVPPLPSWRAIVGIGGPASGGTLVKNVSTLELALKRTLKPYYTASGSQDPYIIQRGKLEVTGKLNFVADSEAPFLALLGNTQPALQLVISNGASGAGELTLTADVAKAAYQTSKFSGGNEAAEYDVEWKGVATTTNAGTSGGMSPCKVIVSNAVTTY